MEEVVSIIYKTTLFNIFICTTERKETAGVLIKTVRIDLRIPTANLFLQRNDTACNTRIVKTLCFTFALDVDRCITNNENTKNRKNILKKFHDFSI